MDPKANEKPYNQELLDEIPVFENFLHQIGFKRNEGAIYGLLVLSATPLTSEEIEKTLHLSQSAVSLALKKLTHYGAIETRESRDKEKRVKEHTAKTDSLTIVSSVFRKREQETIEEFKRMAERALKKTGDSENTPRAKRLHSIISTCNIAETVMNFVIGLATIGNGPLYEEVVANLPKALQMLTVATKGTEQVTKHASLLTKTLKENILWRAQK
ncbi:MAG: helix-turn-helix domain-containing protein [Bdellovibrionota bacterium]|nr:helix-turn-helix domain-containing protein [Bdellovibrionota bacterium]